MRNRNQGQWAKRQPAIAEPMIARVTGTSHECRSMRSKMSTSDSPKPRICKAPRESQAARTARAKRIADVLADTYADATCALHHKSAFQLLAATILSAQCTDE